MPRFQALDREHETDAIVLALIASSHRRLLKLERAITGGTRTGDSPLARRAAGVRWCASPMVQEQPRTAQVQQPAMADAAARTFPVRQGRSLQRQHVCLHWRDVPIELEQHRRRARHLRALSTSALFARRTGERGPFEVVGLHSPRLNGRAPHYDNDAYIVGNS